MSLFSGDEFACENCPLKGQPRVRDEVSGDGSLVIVGLYPGSEEVAQGRPFVGRSGQLLRSVLADLQISNYTLTNVVSCAPPDGCDPQTLKAAAQVCSLRLLSDAKIVEAILLGELARDVLFKPLKAKGVKVRGLQHPAQLLRTFGDEVAKRIFKEEFERAVREVRAVFEHLPYKVVSDAEELREALRRAPYFSIDYEVGKNKGIPYDPAGEVLCVAVATPAETFVIPALTPPIVEALREALLSPQVKVAHNWIFEWVWSRRLTGKAPRYPLCDTLLLAYILDEARVSYNLKHLCQQELGAGAWGAEIERYKEAGMMEAAPKDLLFGYCAADAHYTLKLYEKLSRKVASDAMHRRLSNFLHRLIAFYGLATDRGICVDEAWLDEVEVLLRRHAHELLRELEGAAWRGFNPLSPQQVAELLYKKLGMPILEVTETGQPSTREHILKKLLKVTGHEVLSKILRYREVMKLLSAYVEGLRKWICSDGRVRPGWKIHGTDTGRVTCSDPAIQTIPATGEANLIRGIFVPFGGRSFLEVDFKTHEVRVLLALAGDPFGRDLVLKGLDFHKEVAARLFQKSVEYVTDEERRIAKGVTFGMLYGMSHYTLAEEFGLSEADALTFVERFYAMFPKVREWQERMKSFAESAGYVYTPTGRYRRLPQAMSPDPSRKAAALRRAINSPVQGYASDLCLLTALNFYSEAKVSPDDLNPDPIVLVTIHDALLIETSDVEKSKEWLLKAVERTEREEKLSVPLGLEYAIHTDRWQVREKETLKP